jgi:hypothetical protein
MPPKLALEFLYDSVLTRFALEGPANVAQPFGWRQSAQQHVGHRIVWTPGNPMGAAGELGPPRNPGGVPRSLATLLEYFYVVISAQDPSAPEDEKLQWRVTRQLYDYWLRAVYLAAYGTYAIRAQEWNTSKLERRFGTAIVVIGTIQSPVLDVGPDGTDGSVFAPADTNAVIENSELNVTETLTVAPTDVP